MSLLAARSALSLSSVDPSRIGLGVDSIQADEDSRTPQRQFLPARPRTPGRAELKRQDVLGEIYGGGDKQFLLDRSTSHIPRLLRIMVSSLSLTLSKPGDDQD